MKLIIILLIALLINCKKREIKEKNYPVAKVGKIAITKKELEMHFPSNLKPFVDEEEKKRVLNLGIETLLYYLAAKDEGFLNDSIIRLRIKWSERLILAEEYIKRKVESKIQIKPSEVENFYEINRNNFEKDITIAYVIGGNKNQLEEIRNKMINSKPEKVIEELKSLPNIIANIEKTNLGVLKINPDLPLPFINAVLNLKTGEISGVVEISPFRYAIVKLIDEKKTDSKREDLLKIINSYLYLQKTKAKKDSIINSLKQKYKVEIFIK